MIRWISFLCLMMVVGCGSDRISVPEQACLDLADAAGNLCERCFNAYQYCFDKIVDKAGGDCGNVNYIRDKDEFYDVCLPLIEEVKCSDMSNIELPENCKGQLLI